MRLYWCLDCLAVINLNKHGRCEVCDSDAVADLQHQHLTPTPEDKLAVILEALWKL